MSPVPPAAKARMKCRNSLRGENNAVPPGDAAAAAAANDDDDPSQPSQPSMTSSPPPPPPPPQPRPPVPVAAAAQSPQPPTLLPRTVFVPPPPPPAAPLPPPPQQQHLAPIVVQNTVGFLLAQFNLEWAQSTIGRIRALEPTYPDVWHHVQVWVDATIRKLERGMPPGGLPPPLPPAPLPTAAVTQSRCEDDDEEGDDAADDQADWSNGEFAVGAAPVLRRWACGWWAVQRIGPTATLVNEVTVRMDPRAHDRNQRAEAEEDDTEELYAFVVQRVASPSSSDIQLTALEITVKEWTSSIAKILEAWKKAHPEYTVVLKFPSAAAFISSSYTVVVDCSRITHLALHVDEMSAKFATVLGAAFNLRPSMSLQIHAKSWRLTDVGKLVLFANEPRQLTLSTPFVKRVANFLASLPAGCRELVLPQFGMRAASPELFSQLTAVKGDRDENFQKVTVGECKVSKDGGGGMTTHTLHALLSITADVLRIEQRFPASTTPYPVPSSVLNAGGGRSTIAATAGKTLEYTTTMSTACCCSHTQQQQHQVVTPVVTAIVATLPNANMGIHVPTRCLRCGVIVFNRRSPLNSSNEDTFTTVETLYVETLVAATANDKQVLDFVSSGAMANVRNLYLGESVGVVDSVISKFVGRFKHLNNLVTMLPRYSSRTSRSQFLQSISGACPELHRVCLTRCGDRRDAQCFSYGVVAPPSNRDYVVSRVRWWSGAASPPPLQDDHEDDSTSASAAAPVTAATHTTSLTPAYAAAFSRCMLSCSHPPFATEGLYMFKHV